MIWIFITFIVLLILLTGEYQKNRYFNFWDHFRADDGYANFFDQVTGGGCNIYTNFGKEIPILNNGTNIYWSGEPYHISNETYDMSIVMNEGVPKSIIYPLFAIDSHGDWDSYKRIRKLNTKDKFCAFVVSNCDASSRITFFERLSKYKKVDSYGKCLKNTDETIPKGSGRDYLDFIGRHKFTICFENSKSKYYLTEKLRNAWLAGTIPIYYGSEMAPVWLNSKSFLYLSDDSNETMDKLIEKIIDLDSDDNKYKDMFEEPLMIGEIPEELRFETLQKYIFAHKK
jgi:hypothetical protein